MFEYMLEEKRKKRRKILLMTDYACLDRRELLLSLEAIQHKLVRVFRNHIGAEESITPVELFEQIYGVNPEPLDIYKRNYWWSILKRVIGHLRLQGELFVINKGAKLFVLKTKEEAVSFNERMDRDIETKKRLKTMANKWVRKELWKKM